jgi:hypothetical protein
MNKEEDKNKKEERANQIGLRLPVIGKIQIESFETILEDRNIEIFPRDLTDLEGKIGKYLLTSEEVDKILDLLFPGEDVFEDEKIKAIANGKNIEKTPLILKLFTLDSRGDGDENNQYLISAWANLMLDLGEFKLDLDLESIGIKRELSFTRSTYSPGLSREKDHYSLYAQFDPDKKLLDEIWKRILGKDTVVVLIDDDDDFGSQCGIPGKEKIQPSKKQIQRRLHLGTKIWIAPGEHYEEELVKSCIKNIIESFKKIENEKKKLVFVVDLLYKKKHNGTNTSINRIKGPQLIRYIRDGLSDSQQLSPLIIGFTGGKSPFIINSAVRAGADVVIMKERGRGFHGEGHDQTGSYSELSSRIDPGGLFDLLWALSKNLSRWRFIESLHICVKNTIKDQRYNYEPVLKKLFSPIEDESPFWRKFLKEWSRNVDDLLIRSILFNKK